MTLKKISSCLLLVSDLDLISDVIPTALLDWFCLFCLQLDLCFIFYLFVVKSDLDNGNLSSIHTQVIDLLWGFNLLHSMDFDLKLFGVDFDVVFKFR